MAKARKPKEPPSKHLLSEVVAALDAIAPPGLAQDWDNVGLLAGDLDTPIGHALCCIDMMPAVVDEAIADEVDLVVSYHPPLFRPVSRMVAGNDSRDMEAGIHRCIRHGIAIYSHHTALDAAVGGTNDVLAGLCDVPHTQPIQPQPIPSQSVEPTSPVSPVGIGRVGELAKPTTLERLARRLAKACSSKDSGASPQSPTCVSLVGAPNTKVRRAIVCVGAAGSLPFEVEVGPGDVVVTGEMRHHDALRILRARACAIALSHWSSERPTLPIVARRLEASLPGLRVALSKADREPFSQLPARSASG